MLSDFLWKGSVSKPGGFIQSGRAALPPGDTFCKANHAFPSRGTPATDNPSRNSNCIRLTQYKVYKCRLNPPDSCRWDDERPRL